MSEKVNITGLNKADVLAALYNASKPLGMGFLHFDPKPMTREEAQIIITANLADMEPRYAYYFDYLMGRVMKVDLANDEFDPFCYDRDNGTGSAQCAIDLLLIEEKPDNEAVATISKNKTFDAAHDVLDGIDEKTNISTAKNGMTVVRLGLSDVAEQLKEAIRKTTGIERTKE